MGVQLPNALMKYLIPIMFHHLYLHLAQQQETNPYFYELLQSQKSPKYFELLLYQYYGRVAKNTLHINFTHDIHPYILTVIGRFE